MYQKDTMVHNRYYWHKVDGQWMCRVKSVELDVSYMKDKPPQHFHVYPR